MDEGVRLRVDAEDATVQEDDVAGVCVELFGADESDVEHAEVVGDLSQRLLVLVGCDVREDGERLHQTALLSFGRVAGTHHAKLRRLQGARSANLLCLLHVRADARHVTDGGDVRETRDGLRSTMHSKRTSATPLRSIWKRLRTQFPDLMALTQPLVMMSWNCCMTGTTSKAFTREVCVREREKPHLLQRLVDRLLDLGVVHLEEILEEQRDEVAGHLDSLVAVVVLVGEQTVVEDATQHLARHVRQIHAFRPVVVLHHRHMAENGGVEHLTTLLLRGALLAPAALAHAHEGSHPPQRLLLREDTRLVRLLETEVEVGAILRLVADLEWRRGDESTSAMISWSLSTPMQRNAMQMGMSFVKTLCFR